MNLTALSEPIVQAPRAGGISTPALAVAVSTAGGLGFLAAGYKAPEAVDADIRMLRSLTAEPFGVQGAPGSVQVERSAHERSRGSEPQRSSGCPPAVRTRVRRSGSSRSTPGSMA